MVGTKAIYRSAAGEELGVEVDARVGRVGRVEVPADGEQVAEVRRMIWALKLLVTGAVTLACRAVT